MSNPMTFYSTSIGKKVVMAITGFIVVGFLCVHMLGNLQIFGDPEKINNYAKFLHGLGPFLWVFRAVMLLSAVIHVISATQVTLQSWSARPQRYKIHRFRETTYAARTMRWGGPIIAVFLVYHLLHFTTGQAHPQFAMIDDHDVNVYNNIIVGFQVWWSSAIYIVAMLFVGLHLYHGVWSMFQSLGINHEKWNVWRRVIAVAVAMVITAGNISIPVSVLAGVLIPV